VNRLNGKVAVVTGGNSGIGLASAQRLQQEGARVAISGRSQKTLDEASKILGKDALVVQADVAKLPEIDKFFSAVSAKFGKSTFSSSTPGSPSLLRCWIYGSRLRQSL